MGVAEVRFRRARLLGLPVDLVRREDLLAAVPEMARRGGCHHLVALNPIKVMRALEEPDLRAAIEEAAVVYPDGVGITWALKVLHGERLPALPGCELMDDLLELAGQERWRVFLVGARPEVLECFFMTGEADVLLRVVTPSVSAYDEFVENVVFTAPGVSKVQSHFALRQIKYETALPLPAG